MNIYNAIASVPELYVQVLHLMNRMNLPTPFGSLLPVSKEFYMVDELHNIMII
jgi:U11/U12 small nuclear ribonucleoprotein SNRNP65